jgi:protocatechuate 3,4-dioxygenase beta subunit
MKTLRLIAFAIAGSVMAAANVSAQPSSLAGTVRDETGGVLPGVSVELAVAGENPTVSVTDRRGEYRFDRISPGRYELTLTLINFASLRRLVASPRTTCASMPSCTWH